MTPQAETLRLAKLGWPPRLIQRELNIGSDRCHYYLEDARKTGEVGRAPKGYNQNGTIPLVVNDTDLRACLDLSKVLGISPREVAELALQAALKTPTFMVAAADAAKLGQE